jgi:hypothetical protein
VGAGAGAGCRGYCLRTKTAGLMVCGAGGWLSIAAQAKAVPAKNANHATVSISGRMAAR